MTNFWLMEQDRALLGELYGGGLTAYKPQILVGHLDNPGLLAKIGGRFVLGRERILIPKNTDRNLRKLQKHFVLGDDGVWRPNSTDYKYSFVRVGNSSAYPEGLVLTPHPSVGMNNPAFASVKLEGDDTENFVTRVFKTYGGALISKSRERDFHLFLYSTYDKA